MIKMIRQRRHTSFESDLHSSGAAVTSEEVVSKFSLLEYFKFIFYCMLLLVPIYAIAISAMKRDWLMMMIDALLVPVGFVHGLLLLFGIVN